MLEESISKVRRIRLCWKCANLTDHSAHNDGCYQTPDDKERSYFTLHLYLNDAENQLEGGATTFYDYNMTRRIDVEPKSGRILLFQHRNLLHSGEDVVKGIKYTLRTDIMYTKQDLENSEE